MIEIESLHTDSFGFWGFVSFDDSYGEKENAFNG